MKKEINDKGITMLINILTVFIVILFIITLISANLFDDLRAKITGKATQTLTVNISVGGPQITNVYNDSGINTTFLLSNGPDEAPVISSLIINFSVDINAGVENLNVSTAKMNVTLDGSNNRTNSSCELVQGSGTGTVANFSCNISLFWWDATGTWTIIAEIYDNESNSAINNSAVFTLGERTAFVMSPASLTYSGLSPGATNKTSNNDPLTLNNTGNDVIDINNIDVNATNLKGETDPTYLLHADNFTVSHTTGGTCTGSSCLECTNSSMTNNTFVDVSGSNLTSGNYTINSGNEGQEQLYFCLTHVTTGISSQSYSTNNEGAWTVRIL